MLQVRLRTASQTNSLRYNFPTRVSNLLLETLTAEIIAIGSELLAPDRSDTNSLWLTEKLNSIGIEVKLKTIVGDDDARLEEAIKDATRIEGGNTTVIGTMRTTLPAKLPRALSSQAVARRNNSGRSAPALLSFGLSC